MKKEYVNLKVKVVDVQLSDCIAGSERSKLVKTSLGTSATYESDNRQPDKKAVFSLWE